ncbi:hypothetical protein K3N28_19810 [Glycomyces sp. TRM65418]|uniref:hypothetical protein n=1 Tax=Glycomyces sp. TRM65418 TaxID=2867006 RepID=UPI001CE6495E|nr:hypothetical protein [Glycomyces sp. TRM65418]MCC3765310.1 hypothetical protein [Glycomyces sp. TRM65418]QZD54928.1 hypothetical protein K3N28_19715 [Glycomyces sp. TRM65418]
MRASFVGMLAGMLLALAIVMGDAMAVLLVIVLGGIGFVVGAMLSGEHRSFRRTRRRRR